MILTTENYKTISKNTHVLALVFRLLSEGETLVATDAPKGQYVCSCDVGTVQRVVL